jgi:hypothetical protein
LQISIKSNSFRLMPLSILIKIETFILSYIHLKLKHGKGTCTIITETFKIETFILSYNHCNVVVGLLQHCEDWGVMTVYTPTYSPTIDKDPSLINRSSKIEILWTEQIADIPSKKRACTEII